MDPKQTQALSEKVLDLIRDMPDESVGNILSAWNSGEKITKYNAGKISQTSGNILRRLEVLVANPDVDHSILYSMFVVGMESKSRHEIKNNKLEIVWTGPNKISSGIRNTKPVIEEMLKSANVDEKVILVDYMITSNAESIVDELNSCLNDGVKVDLILDNNSKNRKHLRKCFAEKSLTRPRIFIRKEKESAFYKVHAKMVIVGNREMLLTSANLTELGTEVNFEMGLLVSGPIVSDMVSLLSKMIEDKYFEEVD
jgi:phosphatidylserine/phosphatidylglycerophosphate/cardiolipin synthase-like enzyme